MESNIISNKSIQEESKVIEHLFYRCPQQSEEEKKNSEKKFKELIQRYFDDYTEEELKEMIEDLKKVK